MTDAREHPKISFLIQTKTGLKRRQGFLYKIYGISFAVHIVGTFMGEIMWGCTELTTGRSVTQQTDLFCDVVLDRPTLTVSYSRERIKKFGIKKFKQAMKKNGAIEQKIKII